MAADSMIERVARAIFGKLANDPDWDDAYETKAQASACDNEDISQEECFELARAAIEAMREPTLAMRGVCSFETAETEYPAMIDAALKRS